MRGLVPLTLLVVWTAVGHADSKPIALSTREVPLINGLVVFLPEQMHPRGDDLGSPSFELVHDLVHFSMDVTDLRASAGSDPVATIAAHAGTVDASLRGAKVEKLSPSTLPRYALQPKSIGRPHGRGLVYAVYVVVPASTVVLFRFFVDPGADRSYAWIGLANRILATVVARHPDRRTGAQRVYQSRAGLRLDLPTDWVGEHGADGYQLTQIAPLGTAGSSCKIEMESRAPTVELSGSSQHASTLWDGTPWRILRRTTEVEAFAATRRAGFAMSFSCRARDSRSLDAALGIMATLWPDDLPSRR